MSQHDFSIANQGFPSFRADLNSGLEALATNSSGATAPTTTYAYQFWYDTANDLLKMRNGDNDAWITLAAFDQANDEWELRSAVIQAVDGGGVEIKTDDGTTRIDVADNGDVSIDSGTLFVDSANNRVGVGTTNPTQSIHVVNNSAAALIRVNSSSTGVAGIDFGDSDDNDIARIRYENSDNSLNFRVNDSQAARIDPFGKFQFNSGYGSVATAYGCRAWINCDTKTFSIRGSGNVSSISDIAEGFPRINFATHMPDNDYCAVATSSDEDNNTKRLAQINSTSVNTSSFQLDIYNVHAQSSGDDIDASFVMAAVFR